MQEMLRWTLLEYKYKVYGSRGFATIFTKGNNFYDFLFVCLSIWQNPSKVESTLKGKNLLLQSWPHWKREAKMKLTELFPLKVYSSQSEKTKLWTISRNEHVNLSLLSLEMPMRLFHGVAEKIKWIIQKINKFSNSAEYLLCCCCFVVLHPQ